jgi:general secretion pathway protein E
MGIEPFLLSSSVVGVLSQRLVRVLDPALREAYLPDASELAWFGNAKIDTSATLFRPNAAARAKRGGYRGRTGIYELVQVDDAMRQAIHQNAAESELQLLARARTPDIMSDGLQKCLAGITSIDEILRVTRDE